ncbi:MAG: KEOPS complex subunit Pcc1 [Nitrososphaerota archaeon]
MRYEATLRVRFCDQREAEIADLALSPDNKPLPNGLSISVERRGVELSYKISCEDRPLESLIATLDDIAQALILVERNTCNSYCAGREGRPEHGG